MTYILIYNITGIKLCPTRTKRSYFQVYWIIPPAFVCSPRCLELLLFTKQVNSDKQAIKWHTQSKCLFISPVMVQLSHICPGSASATTGLPRRWRGFGHTHEPLCEGLENDKTAFQLVFKSINSTFRTYISVVLWMDFFNGKATTVIHFHPKQNKRTTAKPETICVQHQNIWLPLLKIYLHNVKNLPADHAGLCFYFTNANWI